MAPWLAAERATTPDGLFEASPKRHRIFALARFNVDGDVAEGDASKFAGVHGRLL
jgi:hypothetical protein